MDEFLDEIKTLLMILLGDISCYGAGCNVLFVKSLFLSAYSLFYILMILADLHNHNTAVSYITS